MPNVNDTAPCHTCGALTPIDELDAKDDGTGNYTILECEKCYGPGWLPARLNNSPPLVEAKGATPHVPK